MRAKLIIVGVVVAAFGVAYLLFFKGGSTQALVMEQDTFVKAYVELASLAERMPIGTPEYDREKARILHEMGVEPEQVEKALEVYNEHPELWRPVWDRIQEELEKRQELPEPTTIPTNPPDSN